MTNDTLQRPEPLHVQIRNIYARKIATGELAPGQRLPSMRDMARLHHVAVGTAAKTVDLLAAEKLVETRGAAGTVVADEGPQVLPPRLIFGPQERLGFTGTVPGEHTEVTAAGVVNAPAYVAAILDLEPVRMDGLTPVYRREQVTSGDGRPVRLEVSWFRPVWTEIIPDLASGTRPIPSLGGVAWLIAAASGDPIVRGAHGTEARPALDDGRELPLLGLTAGTVILAAVYTWDVANPGGQLETVEYGEYIVPQGRVIEHTYAVADAG